MESLYDIFAGINKEEGLWKYYQNANIYRVFPFKRADNSLKIIKDYFTAGNKFELIKDIANEVDRLSDYRVKHILSTFLIGINFQVKSESIRVAINNKINGENINNPWLYIWFLTCLYHDIGYIYEEDSEKYLNCDIKYFLPDGAELDCCKELKNYARGVNYFNIRKEDKKIDHGVVGGFRLYAILQELFRKKLNGKSYYIEKDLFYSDNLYPMHALAADAIIRHNIWIDYENKHSNENVANKKISLKEEPFTFLLAICDTVEPIKRFPDINYEHLLKDIEIDMVENKINIKVPKYLNSEQYFQAINRLCDWVEIGNGFIKAWQEA